MRDKGKQKAAPPREARPGLGRKVRQRQNMEKPTQPRNQVNACVRVRLFVMIGEKQLLRH